MNLSRGTDDKLRKREAAKRCTAQNPVTLSVYLVLCGWGHGVCLPGHRRMCQHLGWAEERKRRGKLARKGEQTVPSQRGGKDWDVLRNNSALCGTEDGEVSQDRS